MDSLLWETALTALLLVGAYFLGAFCGCLLRRLVFPGTLPEQTAATRETNTTAPTQQRTSVHNRAALPTAEQPSAAPAGRFERALAGDAQPERASHSAAQPSAVASQMRDIGSSFSQPAAEQTTPASVPVSPEPAPEPSPTLSPAPVQLPSRREDPMPPRETVGEVANRYASTWSTTTLSITDDLENIEGIDSATADQLKKAGVAKYSDIAQWSAADVERMSSTLGLGDAISRYNWIEQATLLAAGKRTTFAERRAVELGAATAEPGEDSGVPRNIQREFGDHTEMQSSGDFSPSDSGSSDGSTVAAQIQNIDLAARRASSPPDMSAAVAAASAAAAGVASAAVARQSAQDNTSSQAIVNRDDLSAINGITPEIARVLNAHGVTRLRQIAGWNEADIHRFDGLLGSQRIAREDWVGQARQLAGLPTASVTHAVPSKAPGPGFAASAAAAAAARSSNAPRSDLRALRSVRSSALVGEAGRARPDNIDDLKRIRGVGVLIERKLRQLGVNTYDEIASWTAADVERVNAHLDFEGKIERENWIEQARILASGAQTEYARRLDNGEA